MATFDCCQGGLKSLIASKLGQCPRCMRVATFGALGAWALTVLLYLVWPVPALVGIGLLVAVGFTALLIAHLVAFTVRLMALRQAIAATDTTEHAAFSPGRRAATARVLRMGLAALLASVFGVGLFGRPRVAHASKCEEVHATNEEKKTTLCAPNETSAKAEALPFLTKKGREFAVALCATFNNDCTSKKCNLKSTGFGGLSCKQIGACKGNNKHWECTLKVLSVECICGPGRYIP